MTQEQRKDHAMTDSYEDILNLPHPVSGRHPRMPIEDRAAQFAPFAALTGHSDAVKETARLTKRRINLSEDEKSILNEKLRYIKEKKAIKPVCITYFMPDGKKTGGEYVRVTGKVKQILEFERCVVMEDDTEIFIDDIMGIDL